MKHWYVQWEGGCARHGAFIGVALSGGALLVVSGSLEAGIAKIVSLPVSVGGGNLPWFGTLRLTCW